MNAFLSSLSFPPESVAGKSAVKETKEMKGKKEAKKTEREEIKWKVVREDTETALKRKKERGEVEKHPTKSETKETAKIEKRLHRGVEAKNKNIEKKEMVMREVEVPALGLFFKIPYTWRAQEEKEETSGEENGSQTWRQEEMNKEYESLRYVLKLRSQTKLLECPMFIRERNEYEDEEESEDEDSHENQVKAKVTVIQSPLSFFRFVSQFILQVCYNRFYLQ